MQPLPLLTSKKQWYALLAIFVSVFALNTYFYFVDYSKLTSQNTYHTNAKIINIYPKDTYDILKIKTNDFIFFTKTNHKYTFQKYDNINLFLLTKGITFINYLQGFYAKTFSLRKLSSTKQINYKDKLISNIKSQHDDKLNQELFLALFLAIPIHKDLREICTNLGISHLIALSGFHLSALSILLYFILSKPYVFLQKRYFPYRNNKFDLMVVISILLFGYLMLTNMVPSLLRAFAMYVFAIFLLRSNIKLLSFANLLVVTLFLISLFPKLLLSIGFIFSISGVFYIFLYIKYTKKLNKYLSFVLFNIFIYLAINPIVHHFFYTATLWQLVSPLLTVLFVGFYPLELFLHFVGYGNLLDGFLIYFSKINYILLDDFTTTFSVLVPYIIVSLLAIWHKIFFYLLIVYFAVINIFIYVL